MTPNDILRRLAAADGLPRDALAAAAEQRAEMVPLFLAQIEEYLAAKAGQRAKKSRALFFIFHLLGDWRENTAYRPLARLLQSPPEELDLVLGDGVTSTSHRVMAAVCDGDPQPLFDIILDVKADEYVRSRMCEALAVLVLRSALPRKEIARFLRDGFMSIRYPRASASSGTAGNRRSPCSGSSSSRRWSRKPSTAGSSIGSG